jgi:hypothetical protein
MNRELLTCLRVAAAKGAEESIRGEMAGRR